MKEITLTKRQIAKVDDADYEWLNRWKWSARFIRRTGAYIAVRHTRNRGTDGVLRTIRMSRVIMSCPTDKEVDHQNHDTLDNQRCNLRVSDHVHNLWNRRGHRDSLTGMKGVSKNRKRWRAEIQVHGERTRLGTFDTPEMAHAAYSEAAARLHGEFACTEANK